MAGQAVGSWTLSRRGLLATAATSLLAACGRSEVPGVRRPENPELVIGANLELTGVGRFMGLLQERALRIMADTLNETQVPVGNLRRTIRLVVRDNKSDPRVAAAQTTELASRENVHAIVGGCLAETSLRIIPAAEEQQVPFISFAAADNLTTPLSERTYVYKLAPDARDMARALGALIRSQKLQRVGLLAAAGPHGDSGVRAVTAALESNDRTLVATARLPRAEGADCGPAAERVVVQSPDAVIIWGTSPFAGAAARAVRDAGYTGALFFDAGAVGEELLADRNSPAVEGAYAVHPISLSGSSLTNTTTAGLARRDFVYRYIHEHGAFSGFAPYGADAVRLIADAARLGKSVDRGRIRAYLATQVVEGIAGAYSFSPIWHGGMAPDFLGVFTVSNGAWSRVS